MKINLNDFEKLMSTP